MGQSASTSSTVKQLAELKKETLHSGSILKQSRWLHQWKKRHYRLIYRADSGQKELLFAHDACSLPTVAVRVGSLQGNGALTEFSSGTRQYCICMVQAGVPLFLSTNTESERNEFVSMIRAVMPQGEDNATIDESSQQTAKFIEEFKSEETSPVHLG